jgi:hypothetical protein
MSADRPDLPALTALAREALVAWDANSTPAALASGVLALVEENRKLRDDVAESLPLLDAMGFYEETSRLALERAKKAEDENERLRAAAEGREPRA